MAQMGETSTEVTLLITHKSGGGENSKDAASTGETGGGWGWRRISGPVVLVAMVGVLGALAVLGGGGVGMMSTGGGGGRAGGSAALLGDAFSFSFSNAVMERASTERYASDPLFQEFRVQPKAVRAVNDKSFLIVSETNYAFAGLACNWIKSVTRQIGEAAAKKAIVIYVTGQKGEEAREILQSCSGGTLRGVFLHDAEAPATAEQWGTKGYFKSTTLKPKHMFEAFQLAQSLGFQHMMFNDVDVAWKADLRKTAPRVDGFAAQNVEIGSPQVCSGIIIANAHSEEAKTIFWEWIALTDVVIRDGKMITDKMKENRIVYEGKTYCGDEDVLNSLVLDAMPPYDTATEAKYGDASTNARNAGLHTRRHTFQLLSPELAPNGRYARGADPKYADEDAAIPILVDKRYTDGAHFRELASAIHVNWCVGLERKVQHLMDYGLWFLNGEETKRLLGIVLPLPSDAGSTPAAPASPSASTPSTTSPIAVAASLALLGSGEEGERADGCRVLFATYPNSGTSWIEQMWSEASDVGAETVYTSYYPNQWQTAWKTTFDTTVMSSLDREDQLRVANQERGECSMIKSHELPDFYQLSGAVLKGDGRLPYLGEYDKVIVVRRNEEDNIAANLRYFQKTRPDCAISLNQSAYFELFAAREKLVYEHMHCGWQKLEEAGVVVMRVNYEDLFANAVRELHHLRNFLHFRETTSTQRIIAAAAKYPPLKKNTSYPPTERLACDNSMSLEDLIAKVNGMTKNIKGMYLCDSSMSWMLHDKTVVKDDEVEKNNLADAMSMAQ